jgi:hypothetical protein
VIEDFLEISSIRFGGLEHLTVNRWGGCLPHRKSLAHG